MAVGALASVGLVGGGQAGAAGGGLQGAAGSSWTTYGGDMARTSSTSGPPLRPLPERWQASGLGGPIHGEPLVRDGRVLVATEPYAAPSAADGLLVVAGDGNVEGIEGVAGYRP